jgi:Zn-dependent protease
LPKEQAPQLTIRSPTQFEYSYTPFNPKQNRFRFSAKELEHIAIATLLVVGVGLSLEFQSGVSLEYLPLTLSAIAFTASFLIHEIAHKIVAQKYGLWAEFRLTPMGAVITAISIPLPFKFISPGAVMVAGATDQKTMGKTAIAGPATNIVLATILAVTSVASPSIALSLATIAWFNAWIATFNLIPFGIFDGLKVFNWDKRVWGLSFAGSVALTVGLGITFLGGIF